MIPPSDLRKSEERLGSMDGKLFDDLLTFWDFIAVWDEVNSL